VMMNILELHQLSLFLLWIMRKIDGVGVACFLQLTQQENDVSWRHRAWKWILA
jgi:hypothetical protein